MGFGKKAAFRGFYFAPIASIARYETSLLFENNPYIPLLISVPNNPLTEKHYDDQGQEYATITHTYTYDDQGNPIKRKTIEKAVGMADVVSETTFQY